MGRNTHPQAGLPQPGHRRADTGLQIIAGVLGGPVFLLVVHMFFWAVRLDRLPWAPLLAVAILIAASVILGRTYSYFTALAWSAAASGIVVQLAFAL
jgi:hypothetical protein